MKIKISNYIKKLAIKYYLTKNFFYLIISYNNLSKIAKILKIRIITIEKIAIKNKVMPEKYIRNMKFITFKEQLKLLKTKVCVVGIGGLGEVVTENLTRIGIGGLRLIDGDVFENHNLNRQIFSFPQSIGIHKVEIALKHLKKINPSISIEIFKEYLTKFNAKYLIDNCEIVIDCLDNIKSRFILENISKKKNIPMISAAIAGTLGHVTTIFPKDNGLKTIFGNKKNIKINKGIEVFTGCPIHLVSIIASLETNEVIKIILKRKTLKNKLLIIDIDNYIFEILKLNN